MVNLENPLQRLGKVDPNLQAYTFAHLKRRFYISQTSEAGLLNITKAIYQ
jgi:hypothetical protein